MLIAHPALEGKVRSTPETAVRALALFWQTVVAAFDRGNRHTFALALLLLAALLFLGWRLVRSLRVEGGALRLPLSDQPGITAAAVMLAWTLPVTVIGAVASSRFADEYALRYFLFPLGLAAVLAIVLLDRSRRRWPWDVALVAGALFVGIGSAHTLRKATPLPRSHLIADCLIGLHKQGVNLQAGISEYWMGPLVREYLPWHPPILNTLNDLQPNFWASTIGPLLRPERYPHESYTFALIRPARDTFGYNYTAATVGQVLPKPARIHVCETDTEVWLYDDMALDTAVRKAGADYLRAKKIRP
ncbi:hypothetical protein [Pseudoduganella chitinolytica]|uniref:Uncharacterized protein n=1 Tax=Pseudoduganella chitinolytica TaxID=34070 RepID=A0ABY8BD91_9BURK|nr:hypothetical protein [Pseudoduganella chitinolytica]WEF32953.1 hypothetical protein PX653_26760 [Pseudoduganella chitinolytica]